MKGVSHLAASSIDSKWTVRRINRQSARYKQQIRVNYLKKILILENSPDWFSSSLYQCVESVWYIAPLILSQNSGEWSLNILDRRLLVLILYIRSHLAAVDICLFSFSYKWHFLVAWFLILITKLANFREKGQSQGVNHLLERGREGVIWYRSKFFKAFSCTRRRAHASDSLSPCKHFFCSLNWREKFLPQWSCARLQNNFLKTAPRPSSETPAGATSGDDAIFSSERYFRVKVYFKSWRDAGNLFLPNQLQKWSNSVPLIGQRNIFLVNHRGGLAG